MFANHFSLDKKLKIANIIIAENILSINSKVTSMKIVKVPIAIISLGEISCGLSNILGFIALIKV
jgi:hypothetical protein